MYRLTLIVTRYTYSYVLNIAFRCSLHNRLQPHIQAIFLIEPRNPPSELWALQTSLSVSTNILYNGLQSCEMLPNSSWYLGCNGTRVKSPLYERKMKDLFALTNHVYVSLEVRKCLLFRYVSTSDGSILVYS